MSNSAPLNFCACTLLLFTTWIYFYKHSLYINAIIWVLILFIAEKILWQTAELYNAQEKIFSVSAVNAPQTELTNRYVLDGMIRSKRICKCRTHFVTRNLGSFGLIILPITKFAEGFTRRLHVKTQSFQINK